MGFTGQKYGVFESKVWHFWVVTHGVLAEPDNGLWLRRTTRQRDFCFARLQDNESTRQRVGGSRWSFAGIMELRIGRVGSKLKAQSLSILTAQKKQQRIWNI